MFCCFSIALQNGRKHAVISFQARCSCKHPCTLPTQGLSKGKSCGPPYVLLVIVQQEFGKPSRRHRILNGRKSERSLPPVIWIFVIQEFVKTVRKPLVLKLCDLYEDRIGKFIDTSSQGLATTHSTGHNG